MCRPCQKLLLLSFLYSCFSSSIPNHYLNYTTTGYINPRQNYCRELEYFNTFIFTRQRYFEWLIHSDGWQSQNLLKMILFAYETVTEEAKDYVSL
ncbi:hypothetical protein ROSINTL182_06791 [Roseburia intestinalis L1-82]|uniref:Secreted protein n=1 Tax=Roseburia intestinalis L1-82 TaxID=536231 RepID=C7GA60_9FIRM|nr:hypothetical protein ROSINTL182_06791 [Roseburia intestinalis L1-82]